jgi:hypothetical protein
MESEVITMFKQKKNGNFNETVNLSTLPKNISPLKNSHCNNLEEMIIMGADFVRVKWIDTIDEEEVNCETIRFYNEDDSELDGYYIRFDNRNLIYLIEMLFESQNNSLVLLWIN